MSQHTPGLPCGHLHRHLGWPEVSRQARTCKGGNVGTAQASPGTVFRVHLKLLFRIPCRTTAPKAPEFCGFPSDIFCVPKPLVFGIQQSVNPIRSFFLKAGDHMAIRDVVPWAVNGGTISLNLGVIWDISVESAPDGA